MFENITSFRRYPQLVQEFAGSNLISLRHSPRLITPMHDYRYALPKVLHPAKVRSAEYYKLPFHTVFDSVASSDATTA